MTHTTGAAWGVDGCKGGWFFFKLAGCPVIVEDYGIRTTFKDIVDDAANGDLILVDIPIGLPNRDGEGGTHRETAVRKCDEEARDRLGHRRSSVFAVPVRPVMEALRDRMDLRRPPRDDEDKKQRKWGRVRYFLDDEGLSVRRGEGRITAQSFAILPKIVEADDLLQGSVKARKIVRETHPEVCFLDLATKRRAARLEMFSKKHGLGFKSRVAILQDCHPGAEKAIVEACEKWPQIASDDIVDAMACALTATVRDELETLPKGPDEPPTDSKDLPMEIVYASGDAVRRACAGVTASPAP